MMVYRYEGGCPPGFERDAKGNLVRRWDKIQRGDPCPCNSGKKFRKCCRSVRTLIEEMDRQQQIRKVTEARARKTEADAKKLLQKDVAKTLGTKEDNGTV